jgi:hypothetical protein
MRLVLAALFVAALCGCASRVPRPSSVAAVRDPVHITIVYPDTAEPIQAQDSSFLFGSVGRGRGDVALSINGVSVPVSPRGTWLAWLPLPPPPDSLARFQIVARAGTGRGAGGAGGRGAEQQETTFVARIAQLPPGTAGASVSDRHDQLHAERHAGISGG